MDWALEEDLVDLLTSESSGGLILLYADDPSNAVKRAIDLNESPETADIDGARRRAYQRSQEHLRMFIRGKRLEVYHDGHVPSGLMRVTLNEADARKAARDNGRVAQRCVVKRRDVLLALDAFPNPEEGVLVVWSDSLNQDSPSFTRMAESMIGGETIEEIIDRL
jgi:hypothetical protein